MFSMILPYQQFSYMRIMHTVKKWGVHSQVRKPLDVRDVKVAEEDHLDADGNWSYSII
jgi:hypothetical protein